jgi:phosphoadenosine phosphosulfate reductase
MLAKPRPLDRIVDVEAGIAAEAAGLDALHGHLKPLEIIERAARDLFHDEVAAVSSFGADSAVLLHMIAEIDRTLPVIFLDTGKHFEETLGYRDALVADFGLTNIRVIKPEEAALQRIDPTGNLHQSNTDACCGVRKVEPLARGVAPFRAWLTGRKRFQAATRASLPVFEAVGSRIRINPLAHWTTADQADYMRVLWLSVDRLFPVYAAGAAGRGRTQRPLGRPRQDRMWHPFVGAGKVTDRRISLSILLDFRNF